MLYPAWLKYKLNDVKDKLSKSSGGFSKLGAQGEGSMGPPIQSLKENKKS